MTDVAAPPPTPARAAEPDLATDDAAWDAFVAAAAAPSYLQATPWAAVKRPNGWRAVRVVDGRGDTAIGAQLLLRRPTGMPKAFAYAARGPVAGAALDPEAIRRFTGAVRSEAPRHGISHLRIDPEVEDPGGELATALEASGWLPAKPIQPPTTRILDLTVPEDDLWKGIHRKWRQSITKAGRDGSRVVPAGSERLAEFHRIHAISARRARIPFRAERTYRDLWAAFAPAGQAHLFFAESLEGETLATIFLLGWGNRVVDLYGGMTDAGAKRRANYLIKWEAIKAVREKGYELYDLWGLPSEAVARFKAGWGGREIAWVGAWDLVLDRFGRTLFETAVKARGRLLALRRGGDHEPAADT
jgi:peptidoglycan pentaglycine glycine transferase (the first glycine)